MFPQAPQLFGSICQLAHVAPQGTVGGVQGTHVPPLHAAPVHVAPQLPQLSGSDSSDVHAPSQLVSPVGHELPPPPPVHMPVAQTWPEPHVKPHFPQFVGSVCVLVHSFPQRVWPVPQAGRAEHVEYEHWSPVGHALPQPPQFIGSVVMSVQVPLHRIDGLWQGWPPGGMHAPFWQVSPGVHTSPQVPQLFGSELMSVHVVPVPQYACGGVHFGGARTQEPAVHTSPAGHTTPQAPQLFPSVCTDVHVSPQNVPPDGQSPLFLHLPLPAAA